MAGSRTRDLVFLPGQLIAVAVPFVPFTDAKDDLPILVLCDWQGDPWAVPIIVLFAFLIIPLLILASTIRRTLFGPPTRGETWVAYGVSLMALVAFILYLPTEQGLVHPSAIGSAWIGAVGAIAVLASTMKSRVPPHIHAHVAMLVAYVTSVGFFCLLLFIGGWWGGLGPGCWLTPVAVVAYIVEAVVRVRAALRSEGEAAEDGPAGMKRPAPREVAFMITALPGVAVIFLPFVYGYSPIGVLADVGPDWPFIAIALVSFLSVFIFASTVRQAVFGPLSRWEVRAAYALALAALATTSVLMVAANPDAIICPSVLVLAVGAAIVLAATRKGRVPPGVHAHVAMLVAWMPNAAFCLFEFGQYGDWGAGFHLAIAAFVAYAVEAALRVRAALRSEGEPGTEAGQS